MITTMHVIQLDKLLYL